MNDNDTISRADLAAALHMVNRMLTAMRKERDVALAEVERLKAVIVGGNEMLTNANAEIRTLKANQSDGGEWRTEYGWRNSFGVEDWRGHDPAVRAEGDNIQRRVGPVEPITEVSE